MMQDQDGFMWFTTAYGLNRYDGYSFKVYNYNPGDRNSFSPGWYAGMKQDKNGIIWIASSSEGFYSFNPATEKFVHYRHEQNNENSLSADVISGLEIDKSGIIWLATQNGLDAFDPTKNSFKHFVHHDDDTSSITSNSIGIGRGVALLMDDDDNLWLTFASADVDVFNTKAGKVIKHFHFTAVSGPMEVWQSDVSFIKKGSNGKIWITTNEHGLFCYNTKTKTSRQYLHQKDDVNTIAGNSLYVTCEDHNGNLWIAPNPNNVGLDYFDHRSGKFYHAPESYNDLFHGNIITQILEDKSNNIWIATENGIYLLNSKFKKFSSYSYQPGDKNSIASNYVSSFYRDSHGKLYVGSIGVDVFDDASRTFSPFRIVENGKDILSESNTWQIFSDSKGIFWFATGAGLISYNPLTQKHYRYRHNGYDSTSLSAVSCNGILEDSKGRYWVTTWGGGLDAFDPVTGKFRAFKMNNRPNSISTNSVAGLFEDSQGILYMGNQSGGLITFNPDTETFNIFRHNPNNPSTISCDILGGSFIETKSARPDGVGRIIWIATTGGGINAFDPSTKKFRAFTTKDELSDNGVLCIVKDNNGNFWLGTHKGISCFTPPENPFDPKCNFNFRNYDMSDGLPSNEMNYFAVHKDKDSQLFFGTSTAGMFCFYPDDLKDNDYIPPVYITDFKLFNESVGVNDSTHLLSSSIEMTKEITLKYSQDVISFSFAALNFVHSEKNKYAYMLEGFDKDWIYTDATKRFANYTNLDAREYIFKVKGSNNDGIWNERPTIIKLIITPPFWETWWFRILIFVAIAAMVYGMYRYRLREVIRLQMIRNNIASDLHDDIGSTLNSISVLSEVAKQQAGKPLPALDEVGESSRKIVEAMGDIVWTINPENDSFEKIIIRMRSFAYQLLKGKRIEFKFQVEGDFSKLTLPMQVRKNFYLIFKEATTNITKYSQATHVNFSVTKNNALICLSIRDNGVGFDINKIESGNGIKNMQRRAKEINAALIIEPEVGSGTNIQLNLKT